MDTTPALTVSQDHAPSPNTNPPTPPSSQNRNQPTPYNHHPVDNPCKSSISQTGILTPSTDRARKPNAATTSAVGTMDHGMTLDRSRSRRRNGANPSVIPQLLWG